MDNGKQHLHKQLIHAIANHQTFFPMAAEDISLWNQEDLAKAVQNRLQYDGYDFVIADGHVSIIPLPDELHARLLSLKDMAYRQFYMSKQAAPTNSKINHLIANELSGYVELPSTLLYYPYVAPYDETVLFLAPKDDESISRSKQAFVDVLIYDPDSRTYTKAKNMSAPHYDEVYLHQVAARTSFMHGGMMIWIREKVSIYHSGGILHVVKGEAELKHLFSKKEMEEALQECFGRSFLELQLP